MVFTAHVLCSLRSFKLKLKDKHKTNKIYLKSYKTKIKILD